MKLTIHGYPHKNQNKYFRWYVNLIEKRQNDPVNKNDYFEVHHILPKSLGGTNKQENLIALSAKEHYIAHLLLIKFIVLEGKFKMIKALISMKMKSKNTINRYSNSRLYESLRNEFSLQQKIYMKKLWTNDDYRIKIIHSHKMSWVNGNRDKQLEYMKIHSPFLIKDTHSKSIRTRSNNKTNIWTTNNPMKNPIKAKEIASKRSGMNHYSIKNRKFFYEYSKDKGKTWHSIDMKLNNQELCKKYGWSISTLHYILKGNIPKKGPMKDLIIRKNYENYED